MKEIILPAVVALIVSAVYCKVSAVYTFRVIDDYVKNVIMMAKKSIRDAYLKE